MDPQSVHVGRILLGLLVVGMAVLVFTVLAVIIAAWPWGLLILVSPIVIYGLGFIGLKVTGDD